MRRWSRNGLWILALLAAVGGCGKDPPSLADKKPDAIFGQRGMGPGQFDYPRALDVGPDGCVYVVDKTARIQRLSRDGEFETSWRMPEWQAGKPTGVTVDGQGRVLVADTHYHRVIIYDRDGNELARFGEHGTGPGQFIYPTRVAVAVDGTLYVAEYGGNDRISRYTPGLEYIDSFGGPDEAGNMTLLRPQSILLDEKGMLWVADACHHRICGFTGRGELVETFGGPGKEPGQMQYPYDLAWAPDNTLIVCEFGNNRIQRFDRNGNSIEIWGGLGRGPGELYSPWGVKLGADGRLYVLDSRNNRVQMFDM